MNDEKKPREKTLRTWGLREFPGGKNSGKNVADSTNRHLQKWKARTEQIISLAACDLHLNIPVAISDSFRLPANGWDHGAGTGDRPIGTAEREK